MAAAGAFALLFVVVVLVFAAVARADSFGASLTRRYQRSALVLSGTLLDGSGLPAPGVPVSVTSSPYGKLAVFSTVAQGVTDARGRWSLQVPLGESRVLRVLAADANEMVEELVEPGLWFAVIPQGHGRLLFKGGVIFDGVAPPAVVVQDSTPWGWRTFATATPDAHGRFRVLYRSAPSTVGRAFTFRLASLPTPLWAEAVSAQTHSTRVR